MDGLYLSQNIQVYPQSSALCLGLLENHLFSFKPVASYEKWTPEQHLLFSFSIKKK